MTPSPFAPDLPVVELHRHLDGSLRLETILELGARHGLALPAFDLEGLRPHVQIVEPEPSLVDFIAKFEWMTGVLVGLDAVRRVARESVEDAKAEGIDHVELRFSPWFMAEPHGLDPAAVVAAVVEGVGEGREATGISAELIGILSRTYGPEVCHLELEALLTRRDDIVALDLAGDEANFPGRLFVDHFRRGRDAGWAITVHAGEAAGPDSVRQAIDELGATRIGHGVRAIEDEALLETLIERGIGLEVSLTSNLHTSTYRRYADHPLRALMERGVRVAICTDDPGISDIDLAHEYRVAAPAAGLSGRQIRKAQEDALSMAFLSPDDRRTLLRMKAAEGGGPMDDAASHR